MSSPDARLGRLGGVAAVDFLTLGRLAERLAGARLRAAHRLPVSTAVVDLAVRWVLDNTTTPFDEVAEHPSTVVALRDLYRELRLAGDAARERLSQASRRGRDVAVICRLVAERLTPTWYDEGDLLTNAIAAVRAGQLEPALTGRALPAAVAGTPRARARASARRCSSMRVLLGFTGNAAADDDIAAIARGLTSQVVAPPAARSQASIETVSVTDADEEVRHAVRFVVDAAAFRNAVGSGSPSCGRPTGRMPGWSNTISASPASRGTGGPGTNVNERVVPRFLLDLLDVDRRGLRRRDLFDLLADVPVRDRAGRPLPIAAWERASRDAGVVKDEQWAPRLRTYAAWQRRAAADRHGDDEPALDSPASSPAADAAESLAAFVADLRHDLGPAAATRPWSAWADWAVAQINDRLGTTTLQHLDEAEFQAWEHTTRCARPAAPPRHRGAPATRRSSAQCSQRSSTSPPAGWGGSAPA